MRGLDEAWGTWEGVKGGRQPPKRDASSPLFKVTCWQYYGEMLEGSCEKANPWKRLWKWLWAVPALCPHFPSRLHGDDPCPAGQLPAPQGGMPAPSSILSANTWACAMSQAWLGPGGCASCGGCSATGILRCKWKTQWQSPSPSYSLEIFLNDLQYHF